MANYGLVMLTPTLTVEAGEFSRRTGWMLKPEGACKGEVCVPLPADAVSAGGVDVRVVANRLGMPLVHDDRHELWSVGPETAVTGRSLTTAAAPELVLPDLQGRSFALSSLRGQKVVLVAWASW